MYSLYTAGASPLMLIRIAIAPKIVHFALKAKILVFSSTLKTLFSGFPALQKYIQTNKQAQT
jgi:hypothetical protein